MDKAVAKGDFREVERISRELYDIQFAQAVKEASIKASYEMKELVGLCIIQSFIAQWEQGKGVTSLEV